MHTPWTGRADEREAREKSAREERLREELSEKVPSGSVLDVGCGHGLLSEHVDGPYTGLDWEPELRPDIIADSGRIPAPDGTFGTAVCKNHVQHVREWKATVAEMARVAAHRAILFERVWDSPTEVVYTEPCLRRRFNPDDLISEAETYGEVSYTPSRVDGRMALVSVDLQ